MTPCEDPVSMEGHPLRCWGSGLWYVSCGGTVRLVTACICGYVCVCLCVEPPGSVHKGHRWRNWVQCGPRTCWGTQRPTSGLLSWCPPHTAWGLDHHRPAPTPSRGNFPKGCWGQDNGSLRPWLWTPGPAVGHTLEWGTGPVSRSMVMLQRWPLGTRTELQSQGTEEAGGGA